MTGVRWPTARYANSVFVMQSASFLAHQREMQRHKGRDNGQTLFAIHATPSDNQIRNLLAFLLHTIVHLTHTVYRDLRQELGTRRTFFSDIRTLTRYMLFDRWSHLLDFMFVQLELESRHPINGPSSQLRIPAIT